MRTWRTVLEAMVAARYSQAFPLNSYRIQPGAPLPWPESLPSSAPIRDFYRICDGGVLSDFEFSPLASIEALNRKWLLVPNDHLGQGPTPLVPGRHLVLGQECCEAPLVWDSGSGCMGVAWHGGQSCESYKQPFEAFMDELFTPRHGNEASAWDRALGQVLVGAT